ncbi:hypothetical protein DNU06_11280 [Putridiphycobacter roseus]|uniref:Glycosyltransferase RgtA/B/C/D-like domain-containing protein n=1 Tax=Putridiphycobacter roseus TaxID=2219161 RepID=A0A2W1N1L2_9FLAO|nr:glycosyltransferase family 39 protein [Putridiphycobacter roseus]PZE16831.1 hypothetical protein DNU06_11280 [Putridiphycobacter roseus]
MKWHSKNLPFYAFVIAFFLLMLAPYLLSHGMFMDGIMYATISNNLANGIGSVFDLKFTDVSLVHFREHPPMAFWIESLFYRLFGDSYLIEKLYSATTYILTGLLIRKIWIQLTKDKTLGWLPLLFWVSIPIITQAARNNLLENTLMIFTTAAVYFLIKNIKQPKTLDLFLAGICIYMGFMSKGFVALFIWSFPFWVFIFYRTTISSFLKNLSLLLIFTFLPFVIISLLFPESLVYLKDYFEVQVANSLKNVATVDSRFWIVGKLLKELITPGIITAIVLLINYLLKNVKPKNAFNKEALLFLALGISGVLPIIISLKQSGFYSIPAYVFISLAFALFLKDEVNFLYLKLKVNHWGYKLFKSISYLAIAIGIALTVINSNTNSRDKEKLNDIAIIETIIGQKSYIEGNNEILKDWTVLAYLYRYYKINIISVSTPSKQYYLTLKSLDESLPNYTPIALNLTYFQLYEHK